MALIKTRTPGRFFDEATGQIVVLEDVIVTDRYDTQVTASGAVAANTEETFYETLTDKLKIDANFPAQQRLCSTGEELDIEAFGVRFPGMIGNTNVVTADVKKASENLYFKFLLNGDIVAEGGSHRFPTGYGLYGQTTENNIGIVENGIPSPVQRPRFTAQQAYTVDKDTRVQCSGFWQDHVWDATNLPTLAGKVWTRAYAHGILHAAATKNT